MNPVSFTGGARVGWFETGWPLARLAATDTLLTLNTMGKYEFVAEQVVALEKKGGILASGIQVVHNRSDYPRTIIFSCIGGRQRVLDAISQAGFVPRGMPVERATRLPLRWSVLIALVKRRFKV